MKLFALLKVCTSNVWRLALRLPAPKNYDHTSRSRPSDNDTIYIVIYKVSDKTGQYRMDKYKNNKTQYLKAPIVLTLILMLWVLTNCSLLCSLWVLYMCILGALWVLSDCWLTADWFLIDCLKFWAKMMKIESSRQTWIERTNEDCDS